MTHSTRCRPADYGPAPKNKGGDSIPIAVESSTNRFDDAGLVTGVYVAVVQIRGDHVPPRYRRRTYWNLPSAQRAVDKAVMEGLDASVILAQLVPVIGGGHRG